MLNPAGHSPLIGAHFGKKGSNRQSPSGCESGVTGGVTSGDVEGVTSGDVEGAVSLVISALVVSVGVVPVVSVGVVPPSSLVDEGLFEPAGDRLTSSHFKSGGGDGMHLTG